MSTSSSVTIVSELANESTTSNTNTEVHRLLTSINLTEGFAGDLITDMLRYAVRNKKIHENIDKQIIEDDSLHESTSKSKKVTSGTLYQRGKVNIDHEVLAEIETRNKKKEYAAKSRIIPSMHQYYIKDLNFTQSKEEHELTQETVSKMDVHELKLLVKWIHRKGDVTIPTSKSEL